MNVEQIVENIRRKFHVRMDAEKWEEDLHPRDESGKFTSGGGTSKKPEKKDTFESVTSENADKALDRYKELMGRTSNKMLEKFRGKNVDPIRAGRKLAEIGMLSDAGFTAEEEKQIVADMNESDALLEKLEAYEYDYEYKEEPRKFFTGAELKRDSLNECETRQQLSYYMKDKYGINVHPDFGGHFGVGVESAKNVLNGIGDTAKEFPELSGITINSFEDDPNTFMSYDYRSKGGIIAVNDYKINDDPRKREEGSEFKRLSEKKHFPPNTNEKSMAAHECAHALEHWIAKNCGEHTSDVTAMEENREASKIVKKAIERIGGDPSKESELIGAISKYALTNYSETMAEAFGDCYANGENANPLSKAIKEETKNRIREVHELKK